MAAWPRAHGGGCARLPGKSSHARGVWEQLPDLSSHARVALKQLLDLSSGAREAVVQLLGVSSWGVGMASQCVQPCQRRVGAALWCVQPCHRGDGAAPWCVQPCQRDDMSSHEATGCGIPSQRSARSSRPVDSEKPKARWVASWKSDPEDCGRSQIQFYCKLSFTPLKIKSTPTNNNKKTL